MTHRVTVTIPYFTGIPEDVITNVWHFRFGGIDPITPADYALLRGQLETFYESVYNAAIGTTMAPWCRPALTVMEAFNLADPTPRVPVFTTTVPLTVSATGTPDTPPELAVCLSYQADLASGEPQARRRGRIFLGGWGTVMGLGGASAFPDVTSQVRTGICAAATALRTAGETNDWVWVVHSRVAPVPDQVVTNGWVDNAPDTQRRRGNAATARTTWT